MSGSRCYFGMSAHKMYLEYVESVLYASIRSSEMSRTRRPADGACPADIRRSYIGFCL